MKKVAIVGFAPTKTLAPYNDPEFEIWGLNDLFEHIPKWDRWFEIHNRKDFQLDTSPTRAEATVNYIEKLKKLDCPIYMVQKYPDIPQSVEYPLQAMIDEFGGYFTNSISYMIALAIHERFEEIHVYGVDMAVGTEYNEQRPSCEYFLGIAVGRGIKIHIPLESDLLKTRFLYGFEQPRQDAWEAKLRKTISEMEHRKQEAENALTNAQRVIDKYTGAIQASKELGRTWG